MEAVVDDLGKHFIVKDKVVGVGIVVNSFQHLAGEGAVSRVLFRKLIADQ